MGDTCTAKKAAVVVVESVSLASLTLEEAVRERRIFWKFVASSECFSFFM